ncbi:MAG: hypothetical protein HQK55_02815 [Deltaproteobacteria bacterium]|nr:hypothetical protein [Deltaproteobacteria bacterium]
MRHPIITVRRHVRTCLRTCFLALMIVWLPISVNAAEETWKPVADHPYKKQVADGYCNCIFSHQDIPKGRESTVEIKSDYVTPEPVYGRCYWLKPIGAVRAEDFWHEIWIDGRLVQLTEFQDPPAPEWDQIAVWVSEDYSKEMKALKRGKHEVVIYVMKNTDQPWMAAGRPDSLSGQVILSKGRFTYTVK